MPRGIRLPERGSTTINEYGFGQGFCLRHPGLHLLRRRQLPDEFFGGIRAFELLTQVFRAAVGQLRHAVDSGGFQQVGEFAADALDAVEVGVVGPFEDLPLVDPARLRQTRPFFVPASEAAGRTHPAAQASAPAGHSFDSSSLDMDSSRGRVVFLLVLCPLNLIIRWN
jgi:hypothetical protein